jgi:3-deoxy-D-manno-octulosonate 8-phosphate phosphatase (KDO 8-P phosphatase)
MPIPPEHLERARAVRAIAFDVDGVLTDGGMYVDDRGRELRRFDVKDGLGIARLRKAGFRLAMISSDVSRIARFRAKRLGIRDVRLGAKDKAAALRGFLRGARVGPEQAAFVGDDLTDLPAMRIVGFAIAVADAATEARAAAHWVTERPGGRGAAREIAEALLAIRADSLSG